MTMVVAAAVVQRNGLFLVTRRQRGTHLEGLWEFPGGKCHEGESLTSCLSRELQEELAVLSDVGGEILTTVHDYPGTRIELHFFACRLIGEPTPQLGQEMRWVAPGALDALEFPPADAELIEQLRRRGVS
ncbi:MAG TPA: (deoxy)nucleoside triphosphate pyrophosphohydrolase [Vicinamibacterales bacterium]|jgi:mutator protein MutT